MLTAIDGFVVILNSARQALAANENVLCALGIDPEECLGKRPGELFDCVNAWKNESGCGTARECSKCGAVLAILATQDQDRPAEAECLLTRRHGNRLESAEFRVRTAPLFLKGHRVTTFVLEDVSAVKRRETLERAFLHDVGNTIGALRGLVDLWEEGAVDTVEELRRNLSSLTGQVLDEIENHRIISSAEKGELDPDVRNSNPREILETMGIRFKAHPAAKNRYLQVRPAPEDRFFLTDPLLLVRILVNMVKNAFEASCAGDTVTVWFEERGGRPCFCVHNAEPVPEDASLQIFKRTFSTKPGKGRGLGTYSMKLIGENFLGGSVDFTSSEEEGTLFFIVLPETPPG